MQALRLENERLKNSLDPSSVVRPGPVTRGLKETHGSFFLTNYFLSSFRSIRLGRVNKPPQSIHRRQRLRRTPPLRRPPPLRHPPPLRGLLPHPRLHHLLRPLPQLSRKPHLLLLHQRPQQAAILLLLLGHL